MQVKHWNCNKMKKYAHNLFLMTRQLITRGQMCIFLYRIYHIRPCLTNIEVLNTYVTKLHAKCFKANMMLILLKPHLFVSYEQIFLFMNIWWNVNTLYNQVYYIVRVIWWNKTIYFLPRFKVFNEFLDSYWKIFKKLWLQKILVFR